MTFCSLWEYEYMCVTSGEHNKYALSNNKKDIHNKRVRREDPPIYSTLAKQM